MRYRVSCAGEDVLGYLPKGGYFDDPDEAIVRADYAGACVLDTLTGDYSLTPECDEEIEAAKARLARREVARDAY